MSPSKPRRVRVPSTRATDNSNVYQRHDGRYEIGYRNSDGRQRWQSPFQTLAEARAWRDDVRARRGKGERVQPNPQLRFGDAADRFMETVNAKLRPATQSAYGASMKHLRAEWEGVRLDEITVSMVAAFVSKMETRGYAGWTIKGALTVLGRTFDHAGRHLGWHGSNPVRGLERSERPKSDEREKRILDSDERDGLLAAVEPDYRLLFTCAAATGARLGEVLGLRWHGVNLAAGTVHFSHQLDRRGEYVELKTKRSRRTIEIPASLAGELRAHRLASPYSGDHDYVFPNRQGRGHDHRNIGGRVLARAVKRANVGAVLHDGRVVKHAPTFHSLRHTHGSALIAAGWDLEEVSARLGHRNVTITAEIYVHAYESAKRSTDRASRLEAMYGSAVEATGRSGAQEDDTDAGAVVRELRAVAGTVV